MNLILTTRCAKGCSFCFTDDDDKKVNNEMDIDDAKMLLDNFYSRPKGPPNIKILGGEPTQYSKFPEVLAMILSDEYNKYPRQSLLVSNILFNEATLNTILDTDINRRLTFLVNGMELDERNRINLFKHNVAALGNVYNGVSIAITLADNKSLEYHKQYIKFLDESGVMLSVGNVRIGLDLSNTNIINNKKYGEIIKAYYELAIKYKAGMNFDCQVPPCVFDKNDINDFLHGDPKNTFLSTIIDINNPNKTFNCTTPAVDVMPDLKAEFCYQTIDTIAPITNIMEYGKLLDVKQAFMSSYYDTMKIPSNVECTSCTFFQSVCSGLCMGCTKGN